MFLAGAAVECLVPPEAGGDAQRLAPVLAQPRERLQQEILVGHRVAHLERRVPRGQHRQVVVVQVLNRLRVVDLQLVVRDLVDPRTDHLAEKLAPRLAADRLRHHADRLLGLDEAEWHGG